MWKKIAALCIVLVLACAALGSAFAEASEGIPSPTQWLDALTAALEKEGIALDAPWATVEMEADDDLIREETIAMDGKLRVHWILIDRETMLHCCIGTTPELVTQQPEEAKALFERIAPLALKAVDPLFTDEEIADLLAKLAEKLGSAKDDEWAGITVRGVDYALAIVDGDKSRPAGIYIEPVEGLRRWMRMQAEEGL